MNTNYDSGLDIDRMREQNAAVEHVKKAHFPKRLREADLMAPGLGVDGASLTAWSSKLRLLEQSVLRLGTTWLILGARGLGKSQMAVELGKHVCRKNRSARFVRAAWLFVSVRSTYQPAAKETEEEAIMRWIEPSLLVIDEIDKRKESEHEDLLIENIVCQRHDDGKDTILIANLTKESAEESLGASICSRLVEGGGVIVCDWKSFRH